MVHGARAHPALRLVVVHVIGVDLDAAEALEPVGHGVARLARKAGQQVVGEQVLACVWDARGPVLW